MTRACYKQIGRIGIDAGLVYIGDPCHVVGKEQTWENFLYAHAPEGTELARQVGELTAVIAQTGYGDGIYPVIARIVDGRIMQITIDFDLEPRP